MLECLGIQNSLPKVIILYGIRNCEWEVVRGNMVSTELIALSVVKISSPLGQISDLNPNKPQYLYIFFIYYTVFPSLVFLAIWNEVRTIVLQS